jgi:light-regulated signal transduction histidine kinase (bacteriophytochrome)
LKDESGKILKWFGSCTDIHDQKVAADLLEEKVKERTKDLEEANTHLKQLNAELEQFTFVSHHDLQEPLRKIILYTGMVKEENYEHLTGSSKTKLDKVIESGRRMSAALRDVMEYAGLSLKEQFKTVDLNQVILSVLADLELVINGKNARISYGNLPVINAVPQQMHQLFYNLINNALKFSRPDELPVINITSTILGKANFINIPGLIDAKHYYEIIVADNGIGFRQDASEKIFGMFQRLHSKEAYAGTGIGLALCKKVVANHTGVINAEGIEGVGAIFKVYLPVSRLL